MFELCIRHSRTVRASRSSAVIPNTGWRLNVPAGFCKYFSPLLPPRWVVFCRTCLWSVLHGECWRLDCFIPSHNKRGCSSWKGHWGEMLLTTQSRWDALYFSSWLNNDFCSSCCTVIIFKIFFFQILQRCCFVDTFQRLHSGQKSCFLFSAGLDLITLNLCQKKKKKILFWIFGNEINVQRTSTSAVIVSLADAPPTGVTPFYNVTLYKNVISNLSSSVWDLELTGMVLNLRQMA